MSEFAVFPPVSPDFGPPDFRYLALELSFPGFMYTSVHGDINRSYRLNHLVPVVDRVVHEAVVETAPTKELAEEQGFEDSKHSWEVPRKVRQL